MINQMYKKEFYWDQANFMIIRNDCQLIDDFNNFCLGIVWWPAFIDENKSSPQIMKISLYFINRFAIGLSINWNWPSSEKRKYWLHCSFSCSEENALLLSMASTSIKVPVLSRCQNEIWCYWWNKSGVSNLLQFLFSIVSWGYFSKQGSIGASIK